MINIDSVTVDTFDLSYLHVSWTIEDTNEDLTNYRFAVYRSESPEGEFKLIAENLSNTFEIFDRTVDQHSKIRKFYYMVVADNLATGEDTESIPAPQGELRGPDLIALEIRRRNEQLLLPRFVGTRVAIFIAKTFGQRCEFCWDKRKRRQRTSSCLHCYNTGYIGGYHKQINGWINMSPDLKSARVEEPGETHPSATTFWMGHYPLLKPRDIIVESTNKRWRVVDLTNTEKRRVPVHQEPQVIQIPKGDIEWKLPVGPIVIPDDVFVGFYGPDGSGLL